MVVNGVYLEQIPATSGIPQGSVFCSIISIIIEGFGRQSMFLLVTQWCAIRLIFLEIFFIMEHNLALLEI